MRGPERHPPEAGAVLLFDWPSRDRSRLMIRILVVGYCFDLGSERRLCEEVHLNLAYRWFCRLGLDGKVLDYWTFSLNRNGHFRESSILRNLFESVVRLQPCRSSVVTFNLSWLPVDHRVHSVSL